MFVSFSFVQTRCHSTGSTNLLSQLLLCRPKPANPLELTLMGSGAYLQITLSQTHCAYLACFQPFSREKPPFFRKWQVNRRMAAFRRGENGPRQALGWEEANRKSQCRRVGSKSIPTEKAGMWPEIRSFSGKSETGLGCESIRYHPDGRAHRMIRLWGPRCSIMNRPGIPPAIKAVQCAPQSAVRLESPPGQCNTRNPLRQHRKLIAHFRHLSFGNGRHSKKQGRSSLSFIRGSHRLRGGGERTDG